MGYFTRIFLAVLFFMLTLAMIGYIHADIAKGYNKNTTNPEFNATLNKLNDTLNLGSEISGTYQNTSFSQNNGVSETIRTSYSALNVMFKMPILIGEVIVGIGKAFDVPVFIVGTFLGLLSVLLSLWAIETFFRRTI